MKRAVLVVAAVLFAAFIAPATRPHGAVAAAATPTPAALQYDEINRMIIPPATPPAPGTFQADYQAVAAPPAQRHGLSAVVNNVMGNPADMMQRMSRGNLVRYTFYKGWIRMDRIVEQQATIEKCQEHQYINLDLNRKTYSIQDNQPPCPTPAGMPPQAGGGDSSHPQGGTADMTMSGTSNDLDPLTIDGIATTGYDQNMQMKTTNSTGSCRDNNFSMAQTKYVSQVRVPRPYCPLPKTMTTGGMMARSSGGGCEPRVHVTGALAGMNDADRLVVYMRVAFGQPDSPNGGGMNMVVERGNVKWFSGADADALFAIPAGYNKQ
ncbi:MAG TPA: hypothetical protein VFE36_17100 [Candidatus Baltobacteraceae bacterium]|jgi:hypothetical protein|nr:hypothetical protein [Candidatus Baltobacteraceae bacterium]